MDEEKENLEEKKDIDKEIKELTDGLYSYK